MTRRPALAFAMMGVLLATAGTPQHAAASDTDSKTKSESKFHRRGMQSTLLLGASMCVPSANRCGHPASDVPADSKGRPRPLFGISKEIGYRIPWLFLGASYSFGLMSPRWDYVQDERSFRRAHQHSVLGVIRPILPIWRLDLGASVSPGWSRQTFRREQSGRAREYTQGFVLGTGAVAAFYITRKALIGARVDFLFNFHNVQCSRTSDELACADASRAQVPPVDQLLVGAYLSHMW